MKKVTKFLSMLLSTLILFASTISPIAALENTEFSIDSAVNSSEIRASVYSANDYNIVRHTMSTNSDELLYFTNSVATMRNFSEDEMIMESYFPGTNSADIPSVSSIINEDNREIVKDTTIKPYRAICRVVTRYKNVYNNTTGTYDTLSFIGTAFFNGANLLTTAGHNIYGDVTSSKDNTYNDGIDNPRFADQIIIQPGAYLDENEKLVLPYGEFDVDTCYIQKEFYSTINTDYDWGICIISEDIGNQIGWLGLSATTANDAVSSNNITVIGYPGDKHGDMYSSKGTISQVTTTRCLYDADTTGGSSGSPVFSNESDFLVEAIHTTGSDSINGGSRITMFILSLIFSLTRREFPCEILDAYYEGTSYNRYNCVLNIVYIPPKNCELLLSKDGIDFDKRVTDITQEFYTSTTSSNITEFSYLYYKSYDKILDTYSDVKLLHNQSSCSTKYAIISKTNNGDKISTDFNNSDNLWSHKGNVGQTIKGTVVYNGQAKNIEVTVPLLGYNKSSEVTIDGLTFQLRTGPKQVSIKANQEIICSNELFFAFGVN